MSLVSGSGRMKLDDEVREVGPLDAIRVAPKVARAFEASSDGNLELIVFGPRHAGDGEVLRENFWKDDSPGIECAARVRERDPSN